MMYRSLLTRRLALVAPPLVTGLLASSAWAFTYTVTGTINYKDSAGNLHPARDVAVKLLNSDGSSTDATGNTDLSGNYTMSFSSLSPFGFTENLDVVAKNDGGYVSPDATPDNVFQVYPQPFSVATGTNTINVNMQNTNPDTQYFASPTFSVLDAIETGWQYATDVRGASPNILPTLFPQNPKDTSFFSPTDVNIHVLLKDRWDWDVILHEYGHYLQFTDKIADNPGGNHSFGVSNIPARGKDAGARLAWGEGQATYIGLAAQAVNTAANKTPLTTPNVGDSHYQDTEDATLDVDMGISSRTAAQGEGDELAVGRILWQVATGPRVNRGHVNTYADFIAAAAAQAGGTLQNLSQYNNYYLNNVATTDRKRADFGSVFQDNGVSPLPLSISHDTSTDPTIKTIVHDDVAPVISMFEAPPTFFWDKGNNGANDTFHLIIWDSSALTNRVIDNFLIPGNVDSYTLTAAQWSLVDATTGWKYFDITGGDSSAPSSGPYWSDAFAFEVVVPEPASIGVLGVGGLMLLRRRRARSSCRV
jgi:hypothetical protein